MVLGCWPKGSMAAPAQRLLNCSTDSKATSESGDPPGSGGASSNLQNGSSMEDLNSDDVSGNLILNNRSKNRANNCGPNRDMKMDNFQDGGPQLSARPNAANSAEQLSFSSSLERTRINSEYQNYNQNTRDPMMVVDEYRNSQEPSNHGSAALSSSGYGTSYQQETRGGYGVDQHGGPASGDVSSQQKQMYSQYQRAGFPNNPRPPMNVGPPRSATPGMGGGMVGNYPNSQQRFLSGQSISQQGGPTPTLNQLLQAPNPLQRFQNSYGEYNNQGMHKDQASSPHPQYVGSPNSPHAGWSPTRGSLPYQQQMLAYRGGQQNAPLPASGDPSIKRPPYMSGGPAGTTSGPPSGPQGAPSPASSPQQGQQPGSGQYGQQQQQQYPPRPYPQTQAPMGSQRGPMGQSYSSQQMGGSPYGMHPSVGSAERSGSGSSGGHDSQQRPPSQQFGLQQSSNSQNQSPQQENAALDDLSSDSNSNSGGLGGPAGGSASSGGSGGRSSTPGTRNPGTPPAQQSGPAPGGGPPQQQQPPSTPTSQPGSGSLQGVSPLRPVPSPSGSSGSRSMSPAIGQQQSIPMPPRPSSSQSDSGGGNTMNQAAPLGTPGYNSQMAPPPMYANKMAQSMMGSSSQLGPYASQPGHYPQGNGNYRHQNSLMMQQYGPGGHSQNNYGAPAPGYPPVMGNRIPNHTGGGPPPPPPQNFGGYHNSQYSAGGAPPPAATYGMNNMMPPPSQYPKSPGLNSGGGAQAAAQAAVIAAAASSGTLRATAAAAAAAAASASSSSMYVRQSLQQKMYSGNYNSLQAQAPGATNQGGPGMAPPPNSGHHQMGIPPGSSPGMPCQSDGLPLAPPTVSTPSSTGPTPMSENSSSTAESNANMQTSNSSMGNNSTSVTQSISSPVPSMMVSSPSMTPMADMPSQGPQMGSQPSMGMGAQSGGNSGPNSGRLPPGGPLPPPHVLDEASQASNASASSSLPDDRSETPKPNKPPMSHPPTPNTLPSPGAQSMSSFHDEFESVSSPSWPRTPASPAVNNQSYDHHPIKRPDGLLKLYDISEDPDRRNFLDKLILYSEERGTPISQCPTISKQPLDLYRLYASVKERGGFVEVTKSKHWKEVAGILGIGASSSAAYTLRKQYIKHVLPYECKYDRGGIDPQPIINQVESTSRKKGAKNQPGCQEPFPPPSSQSLDGYPPGGYPGPYGPGPPSGHHPSLMMNSEYPPPPPPPASGPHMGPYQQGPPSHHPPGPSPHLHGQVPNHMGPNTGGPPVASGTSAAVPEGMIPPDQYSEEIQPPSQYQRHSTAEGYGGYNQAPSATGNTMMPSYSSTQSSMSGGSFGYSSTGGATHQPDPQYNSNASSEQYPHHSTPDSNYPARTMPPQDPYSLPPGSYPPNRTIGGVPNATQYPYQGQYDRERYESSNAPRPASQPGPVLGGPPPSEIPVYAQQRYGPGQPSMGTPGREPVAPQQAPPGPPVGFQGRPPSSMPPTQYSGTMNTPSPAPVPAPYPQPPAQDGYNRVPEGYQSPVPPRMQTSLAQRLLAKTNTPQGYPQSQSGMYSGANVPPNKVAPVPVPPRDAYQRDMYMGGPKRHPDFMKPGMAGPEQYPPPPGPPFPPAPSQNYPDRGQYPYRSGHMGMPPPNTGPGQPAWTRDSQGRPYPANSQGQYPMSRENWDPSRAQAEGPQGANPPWSNNRYGGPLNEPYPPCGSPGMQREMKMSRHGRDRAMYMQQNKMGPHPNMAQGPQQYPPPPQKKELIFPPDTTEGIRPVAAKRRKLQAKDVTPLEAWRLMMAMKSGLLAESTWALDVLSVLLYDDNTVLYFGLSHLPGLLEAIMEHYRRVLNVIFNLTEDIEVGYELRRLLKEEEVPSPDVNDESGTVNGRAWYVAEREVPNDGPVLGNLGSVESIDPCDKTVFLSSENYSFKTRCKKVVRCRTAETLFLIDPDKKWDCGEGFRSGGDHWQLGGGEITSYIQTHFENTHKYTRFARVMQTVIKDKLSSSSGEDSSKTDDELTRDINKRLRESIKKEDISKDIKTSTTIVVPQKLFSVLNCKRNSSLDGTDLKRVSDEVDEISNERIQQQSPALNLKEKQQQLDVVVKKEIIPPEEEEEGDSETRLQDCKEDKKLVEENSVVDENVDENNPKKELLETREEKVESTPAKDETPCPRVRISVPVKRSSMDQLEEESYNRDEPSLCLLTPAQDSLARRCICLSSLLRNLSFVPGNDGEMAKHTGFLLVMGRLLLLNHSHSTKKPPQRHYEKENVDALVSNGGGGAAAVAADETSSAETSNDGPILSGFAPNMADSCSSLIGEREWWWDMLHHIRENTLVVLANISGHLDLTPFPEEISLPILDGLLHWAVCPSSYAQDPLPNLPTYSVLSPQRLSLEALCKLSTMESNVDLLLATPPWSRIERLFAFLSRSLGKNEDQVMREFSVVLLSNLAQADTGVARAVALQGSCISQLITFVEQAEQSALQVANSQGINALRENPELMGTTLDMVRRAAATLRCLAMVPDNRALFLQHQQRLLTLVMSQILDQGVASIVADVLYECSRKKVESPKHKLYCTTTLNAVKT